MIFTGDLIAKGPKSTGVVDLARKHYASCVRGNHEDRVLLIRRDMKAAASINKRSADIEPDQADDDIEPNHKERILARELSDEQAEWLDTCPVILKVGSIKGMGEVVVVHGGLVPGVELESQDPSAVMSMRTIDLLSHVPSASSKGVSWTKVRLNPSTFTLFGLLALHSQRVFLTYPTVLQRLTDNPPIFQLFNKHQSILAAARQSAPSGERVRYSSATTVIYGHDANRFPSLKKYTKGLDTGCVKGGKLSAMIIKDGGDSHIEHVKCKDYTTKRKAKH